MSPIDVIYITCSNALEIDLSSKCRDKLYVYGRFVCYKLCKENIKAVSFSKIGKRFNRNHATVIHGLKKYDEYIETYGYDDFLEIDKICRDAMIAPSVDDESKNDRELRYLNAKISRLEKNLKAKKEKSLSSDRYSELNEMLELLTDEQLEDFINNRAKVYVQVNTK